MDIRDATVAELAADTEAWAHLADAAAQPNVFLDPRLLASAAKHSSDAANQRVLAISSSNRLVGIFPYSVAGVSFGRLRLRAVTCRSTGSYLATVSRHHPLVRSGDEGLVAAALLTYLRSHPARPDMLELFRAPTGDMTTALLDEASRQGLAVLERDTEHIDYARGRATTHAPTEVLALEHLSRKQRQLRRRDAQRLEAELGGQLTFIDAGVADDVIERFLVLQSAGWKGRAEAGGRSYRTSGQESWIRDVIDAFGSSGHARFAELRIDDVLLHTQLLIRSGRVEFGVSDAYDERFRPFGPGALGRLAGVQDALGKPEDEELDTCMEPTGPDSGSLYPDKREVVTYAISLRPRGTAVLRAIPGIRSARDRLAGLARQG